MKKNLLALGVLIAVLAILTAILSGGGAKERSVSVEEAHAMLAHDSTILVLDVRTPREYVGELSHIEPSLLIPVQELEERIGELEEYRGRTILAVCRTGSRSGNATEFLTRNGFHVLNVEGGMIEWNEKKFPVASGEK